jgi:hypothetical protein
LRRGFAKEALVKAGRSVQVDQRARSNAKQGIKPLDALHLVGAVEGGADLFCTCEDRFLKRAKAADTGRTRLVSPLELIAEVEP